MKKQWSKGAGVVFYSMVKPHRAFHKQHGHWISKTIVALCLLSRATKILQWFTCFQSDVVPPIPLA